MAVFALVTWGDLVAKMLLLLLALISFWIIFALRTEEDETLIENAPGASSKALEEVQSTPNSLTTGKLEDSRYD